MFTSLLNLKRLSFAALAAAVLAAGLGTTTPAKADPPYWAKAHRHHHAHNHWHGWRHRPHRVKTVRVERHVYHHRPTYYRTASGSGFNGGHLVGGILGAGLGTQIGKGSGRTAAIIGGAVVGAVIGGEVGRNMQAADRHQAQQALETVPTGRTVAWNNPDTGAAYRVTPTQTYQTGAGTYCRDYTTWVLIDGYEEEARGTACRAPDGTWRPAS